LETGSGDKPLVLPSSFGGVLNDLCALGTSMEQTRIADIRTPGLGGEHGTDELLHLI
jgi:hypothetical protein